MSDGVDHGLISAKMTKIDLQCCAPDMAVDETVDVMGDGDGNGDGDGTGGGDGDGYGYGFFCRFKWRLKRNLKKTAVFFKTCFIRDKWETKERERVKLKRIETSLHHRRVIRTGTRP